MFSEVYSDNHREIAAIKSNIAYNCNKLGNHTEALKYAQASLDMIQKIYPDGHPRTIYSLDDLGASLITVNKVKEGLAVLHQALELSRKFDMDKHNITAFVYSDLGLGYLKNKEYQKALEYAEKALTLRQEMYASAKNHIQIVESLHSLGDIHLALDDKTKAFEFYNEALAMSMTLSLDQLPETRELQEKIKGLSNNKL